MKRSFFDRLSGTVNVGDTFDEFDDATSLPVAKGGSPASSPTTLKSAHRNEPAPSGEGQLPVDVHQTPSDIIIRAFVAGVRPDELSISISRDMVVIEGSRMEREQVSEPDYFTRELFWGSFSRTILLPQEVDVDNSTASAKDGLLTLILPKLDKARQTKLRVKVG
ncbi:MAG: Hsp20/alpha crystallin family protein [bacterium]|nr:Hsp20/alpha crystallin family protein [bacterium]